MNDIEFDDFDDFDDSDFLFSDIEIDETPKDENIQKIKMGRRFTKEQVLQAIEKSAGIVSTIAKRLNCDWRTADKYIKKWKETQRAFEDQFEMVLDMSEGVLFKAIKSGDVQNAKWLLVVKGKNRGYHRIDNGADGSSENTLKEIADHLARLDSGTSQVSE